jgi:hypothetical protein
VTGDLAARVERLELIEAARSLQARYADVIDAQAFGRLGEVFAPDAVVTAPGRRYVGLDAITAFYVEVHASDPSRRRHFVTNLEVDESGADQGVVALRSVFLYTAGTGGESIIGWGTYRDSFVLVDGWLRIGSKQIEVEWRGPLSPGWGAAAGPDG